MTILQPFTMLFRCGLIAGFSLAASSMLHAVAPDAVDDDLTGTPVNQNDTLVIDEADLIANDAGDGINIRSASSASTLGADVTWSNPANTVTYDPTSEPDLIALDSGDSADDTFTYVLQGTDGPDATATVTVRVNGVNDAPTIAGMPGARLDTNDKDATNTPFTGVVIDDPDDGETLTVTVSISPAASGSFSNATGFTNDGSGNYTFTGTAALATTRVAALNFVPAENQSAPGTSADTTLTVTVDDGDVKPVDASRTVRILSINDAPVVTPGAGRNMNDNGTLTIFSNVTLADPDLNEQVTVSVTFDQNKGSFSGTGFTLSGSGASRVLTLTSGQSVANAQSALRALVFTPVANQVPVDDIDNLSFNIDIDDGDLNDDANLGVAVLSVNDAPALSPANVGPFEAASGNTIIPFASVTLTDPDFDDQTPPDNITQPPGDLFTATIVLSPAPYGEIVSAGFTTDGNDFTYTYTGNRGQVENAIRAASFLAPSSNGTFEIDLTVTDSSGKANDTSNTVTASVTVEATEPGMSGLVAGQQLADNSVIFPFASAAFNNFGGVDRVIEITLDSDAKGEFDILAGFTKSAAPAPYTYSITGNSVSATDALRSLRFRPAPNRIIGASETVTFNIVIKDAVSGDVLKDGISLTLTVTPFNDAPTILGSNPEIRIDDDETATPFATINVADPDEGGAQQLTVSVTLIGEDPDTNTPRAGGGTLAPDPAAPAISGVTFTSTGTAPNITYSIVGSPADVTAFLQELVFTPTPDRNAVGQRETIRFTIVANDNKGGSAQNQNTTVIVTSVNGAPQITGVPPLSQQPFPVPGSGNDMTMPFAALAVTDEEDITFTITLDDAAKGTLDTTDFAETTAGVYDMTGTPSEVTAALKALVYTIDPGYAFPPDQPGLTTFTLAAGDSINTSTRVFTIFIRNRNVAHIVTSTADSGPGSLREAVGLAGNGDTIVFDYPTDDFPVTIALDDTITVSKNLHIVGSGTDQLAISGQGSTGIFVVNESARLTLEQLTLKDGAAASYGGAVSVDAGSALTARYCEFSNNSAGQYGGAIDVFEGELVIGNCLFLQNFVAGSIAKAGGAVSIYSSIPSSIANTTFVENRQDNPGGEGGGAVYAENSDLAGFFHLQVEHCTFLDNTDAKVKGSALLSASAGMVARLRNNIFADQQGQVIDIIGGGGIDSLGGNIATDATVTTYTVGSQNITLLDQTSDKRSTNPLLEALADNGGATRTCAPASGSPAIDAAVAVSPVADAVGTDQRGYWRGTSPRDIGAHEVGMFKRVNINEIHVRGGIGTDFIEFYNPRDSEPLDMDGVVLWIDDTAVHTFASETLTPGAGTVWFSTVDLDAEKGRIELRNPAGQRIVLVDYAASFAEEGVELATTGQSINRYPRYEGGFLPHQRVVTNITGIPGGALTSPGDDVDGSELGGGNVPPIAVADPDEPPFYAVFADQTLAPDVLANDIEFDRADTLKITEVMPLAAGAVLNSELFAIDSTGTIDLIDLPAGLDSTVSPQGATVTIGPDDFGLVYDPTASPVMIGLAQGETLNDIWSYTIRDFDESDAPQSRGSDATRQAENIARATTWFAVTVTGVNEAPEPADDIAATAENQAVRFLADSDLLAPAAFNFGDLDADFQDFDASGNPVTLKPAAPTLALLANDDDVDSDDDNTTLLLGAVHTTEVPADLLVTTSELGATVKLDIRAERRETSIVYDPRSSAILTALSDGETIEDSFHYSVFDRHGARGIARVTITVTGVNDVPMATDDGGFMVFEDGSLGIPGSGLLANDTDPDQDENGPDDVLTIATPFATTTALGATLSFDGTTVTYDPSGIEVFDSLARNEFITDTFTYTATDSQGGTSTATVSVIVEGRNDAPVAANDLLEILENNTTMVNAAGGLLANDVDVDINGTPPDDDPWVIPQRGVTTPLGAALDINPDGSYAYDANSPAIDSLKEGELAVETFPYTVIDNSRTTASDDAFKVFANSADIVLPVLLNDVVAGAPPVAIAGYSAADGDPGSVVIESPDHSLRDGLLVRIEGYQGDGGYNGVYPVTSIDRDHFSIEVPFVDDASGTFGTWVPWFAITAIGSGDNGGQLASPDGQDITYTPVPGFYGTETFSYAIGDGVGGQDVAEVAIEVILPGSNGFLSASDDSFRIGMGEAAVTVDVLENDGILPAAGAAFTITDIAPLGGATGTLEIVEAGKALAYTPADPLFTGTESFSYTVTGGGPASASATVTFEVVDRSGRLDGNDDSFFVVIGSSDNLLDVLANDPALPDYPVGSSLVAVNGSATGGATGSGGSAGISGNRVSYTPPNAILTDAFTYTARDASGATVTRTVRVRVVPDATDFFASNDHYIVAAGADPVLLPVLLNDGTVQNPTATLSIANIGLDTDAPPDVGRVAISNGNRIAYTPPAGATTETFTYEIGIGTLARREAVITVTVIDGFATQPETNDDFFHVAKNSGPHTLDVLHNDIPYPDAGWQWEIFAKSDPGQGGTLSITGAGASLSYTPAPGFFGIETFTYAVRDRFGDTATGTVSVRVGEMTTAPDHFAVLQDSPAVSMPVLANDDLLDTYAADYTISAVTALSAQGGSVAIDGAGPANTVLYTPPAGFAGEDSFSYTVTDQTGGTLDETVTVMVVAASADRDDAVLRVEITGINDVPVLAGTADGAITDKQTIQPFVNASITDLDEAGNQLQTVTVSFDAAYGTIVAPGMIRISAGVYRRSGTPAQVTSSLRGIVFTPFENLIDYIDPGQADVVFNLSIDDGYVPAPVTHATTVTVTPVNDAPVISTPIPDQTVQVNAFAKGIYLPFHFADVDDDVPGGQLTWTVTGNTDPTLFDSVTVDAGARLLVIDYAADQAGVSDITVRGTDRGLLFVETTFRVTVEGPPVILLTEGETRPPAATFISGTQIGFQRDYRQSFRVINPGSLPVSAFVVHVSQLGQTVNGVTLPSASYSIDENGTPDNFADDVRSSSGVSILQQSNSEYDVKYDRVIPPGGSAVVHLTYRFVSVDPISIRPTIRISLTTPGFTGDVGISGIVPGAGGEMTLRLNLAADLDYRLEFSPDMQAWQPWPAAIPAGDFPRSIEVVDDGLNTGLHPSLAPRRFYRLAEEPAP
ncbi:MAG TPA: Ig-like domain-containing protein [Luteolibacter sp.]|nr:Ig-like domain-containing protein [Luteolibacter sp.]